MTYAIAGGILVVALIALAPWIAEERRITAKARADHARSRGTHHAKQLREAIRQHERALEPLRSERRRLQGKLSGLEQKKQAELQRALTISLINGSFVQIPGIGPKLKDRIMQTCFDGTLESLLGAYRVYGVGQEKSFAIRSWVHQMKRQFERSLQEDFTGKSGIHSKYSARSEELACELEAMSSRIARREKVIEAAEKHVRPLEGITPKAFCKALRGDQAAAERVGAHSVGAFAEWEPLPKWFRVILRNPDEE